MSDTTVARRLDEEFRGKSDLPILDTYNRMLRALEVRFRALESQRADFSAAINSLQRIGLDRINDVLLPASRQIVDYTTLGWLMVKSRTELTLAADGAALFGIEDGAQRNLFRPTPFLAIQREGNAEDFAVARLDNYDRDSGLLLVRVLTIYGSPGPHDDWVITCAPGVSEATRSFFARAHEAMQSAATEAQHASASAAGAAVDRAWVAAARKALEDAHLDPNSFAWRDGSRPFTSVQKGIAPAADADDADMPVAGWVRERVADATDLLHLALPSYGTQGTRLIRPIAGNPLGFVVPAGTYVKLDLPDGGSTVWSTPVDYVVEDAREYLDTGTELQAGKDYFVYLQLNDAQTAAEQRPVVSLNTTYPDGTSAGTTRKIGGGHTLCVAIGSGLTYTRGGVVTPHPLAGLSAARFLPDAWWCLCHRTRLDRTMRPGMSWDPDLNMWSGIYPSSGTGDATKSVYQGTVTVNRQFGDHLEDHLCNGQWIQDDTTYTWAARGSNEQTNIQGSAAPPAGVAGGFVDTAGRRMVSAIGCEACCGVWWHWLAPTSAAGAMGASYGFDGTNNVLLSSNPWNVANMPASTAQPHPQAGGKGGLWAVQAVLLAGGRWAYGAGCGSRSRCATGGRSSVAACLAARACEPGL